MTNETRSSSELADRLRSTYHRHCDRANPNRPSDVTKAHGNLQATIGDLLDDLPDGSRLLDLGCGSGLLLEWLATKRNLALSGVDLAPGQVEQARRRAPKAEIHHGDGLAFLAARPRAYDAILCFDVLEHLPSDDDLLAWVEAARNALVAGGFFLCRVPNGANLTGAYGRYDDLTHHRAFTSWSLLQLLELVFEDAVIRPVRSGHLAGKIRLLAEHALHRAVFRLCSQSLERFFTRDVYGFGRRS